MRDSNSWPDGRRRALDPLEHEAWNAHTYPGTRQLCDECDQPTGRCEDDSIRDRDGRVFCPDCRPHHCRICGDEPLPANQDVCEGCHWQSLTPAERDESIRRNL